MTYRELLEELQKQPTEILDGQDVTIYDPYLDEYFPLRKLNVADSKEDRLDPGHLFLEAK